MWREHLRSAGVGEGEGRRAADVAIAVEEGGLHQLASAFSAPRVRSASASASTLPAAVARPRTSAASATASLLWPASRASAPSSAVRYAGSSGGSVAAAATACSAPGWLPSPSARDRRDADRDVLRRVGGDATERRDGACHASAAEPCRGPHPQPAVDVRLLEHAVLHGQIDPTGTPTEHRPGRVDAELPLWRQLEQADERGERLTSAIPSLLGEHRPLEALTAESSRWVA